MNTFELEKWVRPNILKMKPFSSARSEFSIRGKDAFSWLDANENPYNNTLNRYPDPYQWDLKKRISEIKKIHPNQIFLGNGSDEVLDLIIRVFCIPRKDKVIIPIPTFTMYDVLANINEVERVSIPLKDDFQLDVDNILNCDAKLLFLCSPNNPNGQLIATETLKHIIEKFNGIIVLDEAYIDFSPKNTMLGSLSNYPNLLIIHTLSKAWGMAGLRLGMCFASEAMVAILNKVKPPYNIGSLTQKRALEMLSDETSFTKNVQSIIEQRDLLMSVLSKIPFIEKVYLSDSNFILIKVDNANLRYEQLIEHSIVVRDRSDNLLCENCLRITVGTEDENKRLIDVLKGII